MTPAFARKPDARNGLRTAASSATHPILLVFRPRPAEDAPMFLHALGTFHPPAAITNAFLESLDIGTTEDWILERVGIRERRTVLPLDYIQATKNRDVRGAAEAATMSNAETGAHAARAALARAGLPTTAIGLVVSGGCTPDEHIPSTASRVAEALGVDAPCFDVGAACSSFVAALHVLSSMRPEKLPDYVLVVNPENSTALERSV
jgi:3-oxoacyl-[acyl-carrier-protein] synthase III